MEMPELNEDILEGESSQEMLGQEDSVLLEEKEGAAPAEDPSIESEGEPKPSEGSVQEGTEESQPETDDNTLDDCELKQDDSEEPMDQSDFPGDDVEKTLTEDDEIPAKIARIDNEVAEPPEAETTFESEEPVSEKTDTGDEPIDDANVKKPEEESPDMDMLSTLASAALKQDPKDPKSPGTVDNSAGQIPKSDHDTPKKKVEPWCNVGVFDTNTTIVTDYVALPEVIEEIDLATATLNGRRIPLDAGTAYKFRVCAVNACGRSAWSDVAAFKTTLPGFPGAPSAIKISKSPDGAHLTWEPPGGASGDILEYAVYLAVRSASQGSQPVTTNQGQLAFVRVFCGPTNKCVVGTNSLQAAHIDTTTKPAIIFRIAARNIKGYGPATQVRWLQETAGTQNGAAQGVKRILKS